MGTLFFPRGYGSGVASPGGDPPLGGATKERLPMLTHTAKITIMFLLAPAALLARPPLPSDQKPAPQPVAQAQPAPQPTPQQRPAQPAPQQRPQPAQPAQPAPQPQQPAPQPAPRPAAPPAAQP